MSLPPDVEASVGGITVRLLNLSAIGALVEHSDRFPPLGNRLNIRWQKLRADVGIRLVRTSITGRKGAQLVYQTGIHFVDIDLASEGVIAAIVRGGAPAPEGKPPAVPPDEDTWTRTVNFLGDDSDDNLPYMRFRMTGSGWMKEYVADAVQPYDGFTIPRSDSMAEALVLQRVFENADEASRRKLQLGIESKLRMM